MKKNYILGAVLCTLSTTSFAADAASNRNIPSAFSPAPTTWSGAYVGASLGALYTNSDFADGSNYITLSSSKINNFGGLVSVSAGRNWQFGSAVFGLEIDAGGIASSNTKTIGVNTSYYSQSHWSGLSTVRARVGFTSENALFYLTGGVAIAKVDNVAIYNNASCENLTNFSGCTKKWDAGLAVGAGLEYMVTPSISIKGEYLYAAVPTENVRVAKPSSDYRYGFSNSAQIARIGLNYYFMR